MNKAQQRNSAVAIHIYLLLFMFDVERFTAPALVFSVFQYGRVLLILVTVAGFILIFFCSSFCGNKS